MNRSEANCQRKRMFESRAKARKCGKIMGRRDRIELYEYLCPHCDAWHLTSKPRKEKGEYAICED